MFLDYYNLQPLFMAIHAALCSIMPEGLAIFLEGLVVGVMILVLYAVLAIILIYMERKVCAAFQCRIGPNRVGGKGRRDQDSDQGNHRVEKLRSFPL